MFRKKFGMEKNKLGMEKRKVQERAEADVAWQWKCCGWEKGNKPLIEA